MFDPAAVPPVTPDEILARYILYSRHVLADNTVKADAFLPFPFVETSMTRLRQATVEEILGEGDRVAALRNRTHYGRAEVGAGVFAAQALTVEADPLPENPNHANAKGWPQEKPFQKIKAQIIALAANFVPR